MLVDQGYTRAEPIASHEYEGWTKQNATAARLRGLFFKVYTNTLAINSLFKTRPSLFY